MSSTKITKKAIEALIKKETQPLIDEITELRAQLKAVVAGLIAEAPKEENTVKTKKVKLVKDALLPPPTTAPVRLMTVPEEKREKEKVKRAPNPWILAFREVYNPIIAKALGGKNLPKDMCRLVVASYLKKEGKTAPTEDDVKAAIAFLESNPDYKSAHAEKNSDSGSVSDGSAVSASKEAKKRGRPKKVKVEEKVVAANPFDGI